MTKLRKTKLRSSERTAKLQSLNDSGVKLQYRICYAQVDSRGNMVKGEWFPWVDMLVGSDFWVNASTKADTDTYMEVRVKPKASKSDCRCGKKADRT